MRYNVIFQCMYTICTNQIRVIKVFFSLSLTWCLETLSSSLLIIDKIYNRLLGTIITPLYSWIREFITSNWVWVLLSNLLISSLLPPFPASSNQGYAFWFTLKQIKNNSFLFYKARQNSGICPESLGSSCSSEKRWWSGLAAVFCSRCKQRLMEWCVSDFVLAFLMGPWGGFWEIVSWFPQLCWGVILFLLPQQCWVQ